MSQPAPRSARSVDRRSLVVAVAGLAILASLGALAAGRPVSPVASAPPAARSSGPSGVVGPTATGSPAGSNPSGSTPSGSGAAADLQVALVPVVSPASALRSIGLAALAGLFEDRKARLIVSAPDLRALAGTLGVVAGPAVRAQAPADVRATVTADASAVGIIRAVDVTADVRALAIDGRSLFGAERVRVLADWPLLVPEPPEAGVTFDPGSVWTLVAGGDVMLDRAVYREAVLDGKGAGFPWDGGTAEIVGSTCCGAGGARLPIGVRTGSEGAVRRLLTEADLALVNLEGPAPDDYMYHPGGLVFTFDPALLTGLRDAGVDVAALANNHISNAGPAGIADTIRHLDALGIGHAGAGTNLAAARRPSLVPVGALTVAVLAYDGTHLVPDATPARSGAAPLTLDLAVADIPAARTAGADIVIVMVHWGTEYTDAVSEAQRRLAAGLVASGADAVIGSHSHWVGPIETIGGRPVLYSLGDLVFQLTHDARTMEGALADLTFAGRRLVQLDLHPTLILDGSQPNLLDPAGDGGELLADVRRASALLPAR